MSEQTFFTAHTTIKQLVEDFAANEPTFLEAKYSEAQARLDFIDKFWMALGWDVNHEREKNPYRQEVKVERGVAVSNRLKKADYAFFAAPNFRDVKFYVEAKKPSRNLDNADDYFQTIRYGWSSNTPLAVLTDFEQFRVVDCRYKPNIKTAENFALKKFSYREYADEEKFREVYYLFSREAVISGSLEEYANSLPKRGKGAKQGRLFPVGIQKSVDESFLDDLDNYREELARSFKNKNAELDGEDLTEAVTRTLDRLVFIRFLEDKLIEPETMMDKFDSWSDFVRASARLNSFYNGIIFKQHFIDSPDFKPDEQVFTDICGELSDKYTSYYLGDIPVHILGSVYERFLGKVIVATDKRAKVEEKPEVRKAGGVYYTPEYIVRYIVENTIGKLIEDKTPEEISEMRFADIACGSGSFLLGVYDYLLRYHTTYYNSPGKKGEARAAGCIESGDGSFMLSIAQRREILRNNIYGVDVDAQAVEVAQLSLALKLLEDATTATARAFQPKLGEKILPDMTRNIVCGNSLIDHDILDGQLFERNEERKLNPMSYEDKFPEIMRRGGFDAIVGNPPYIRIQGFPRNQLDYFATRYKSATGNYDIYINFVERSFNLLKSDGKIGLILPNKFLKTDYGFGLRNFISSKKALEKIIDFGATQVFQATTYTCLLFLTSNPTDTFIYGLAEANQDSLLKASLDSLRTEILDSNSWLFMNEANQTLLLKLKQKTSRLLDLPAEMSRGSSSGNDEIFVIESDSNQVEEEILYTPIFASDFTRYLFQPLNRWKIIFPYRIENGTSELYNEQELEQKFPKAYKYLSSNRSTLEQRKQYSKWYGYSAPRSLALHSSAQIIVPLLADKGIFAFIPEQVRNQICPMASGGFTITISEKCPLKETYILGLLNSKLLFWLLKQTSNVFRGGWITCTKQYFGELPIRNINFDDAAEKVAHDKMVSLVEQMLDAKKHSQAARTDKDKTFYQDRCNALDRQIDRLVYELYALTPEEVEIVEGKA